MAAILCNEGLILTVIGIIGAIEGFSLNRLSAEAGDAFGPGWYLLILSLIMIVCGLYYLASTFRKRLLNKEPGSTLSWKGPASLCILAMMLYSFLIPYLGYSLSTAAFVFVATRLFGEKSWVISTLLAGLSGVVFWFVFIFLAKIPMP